MKDIQINLKKDNEIFTISISQNEINVLRQYVKDGYEIADIL